MRLGERLIAKGLLAADDLERALEIQKERGDKLGKILTDLGFVAPREILITLAEQLDVPLVSGQDFPPVVPDLERHHAALHAAISLSSLPPRGFNGDGRDGRPAGF